MLLQKPPLEAFLNPPTILNSGLWFGAVKGGSRPFSSVFLAIAGRKSTSLKSMLPWRAPVGLETVLPVQLGLREKF